MAQPSDGATPAGDATADRQHPRPGPSLADGEVKRLVREHWSRRAPTFDEGFTHALHSEAQRDAWLRVLRELAGPRPVSVLDVGCGTGFLSLLLASLGHSVRGVDTAPPMLALARDKASDAGLAIEFLEADAEALPNEPDGSYDLVIERHLIWTLPQPERALVEWRRVLKGGGRAALIEGHWGQRASQDEYAQLHDSLPLGDGARSDELLKLLEGCGYQEVTITPLMDAELWGGPQDTPRYVAVGRKPPFSPTGTSAVNPNYGRNLK